MKCADGIELACMYVVIREFALSDKQWQTQYLPFLQKTPLLNCQGKLKENSNSSQNHRLLQISNFSHSST